jgi:hypothetical protein
MRLPNIISTFDEKGIPYDKQTTDKRGINFVKELLWHIEAKKRMF